MKNSFNIVNLICRFFITLFIAVSLKIRNIFLLIKFIFRFFIWTIIFLWRIRWVRSNKIEIKLIILNFCSWILRIFIMVFLVLEIKFNLKSIILFNLIRNLFQVFNFFFLFYNILRGWSDCIFFYNRRRLRRLCIFWFYRLWNFRILIIFFINIFRLSRDKSFFIISLSDFIIVQNKSLNFSLCLSLFVSLG